MPRSESGALTSGPQAPAGSLSFWRMARGLSPEHEEIDLALVHHSLDVFIDSF